MKTMTCKQLGGPCDVTHRGDSAHQNAHEAMKGRWKNPVKGIGWYRDTKKAFAALPNA